MKTTRTPLLRPYLPVLFLLMLPLLVPANRPFGAEGLLSVSGVITRDDGTPVEGVEVLCNQCPVPSVFTDAEGRYEFQGLEAGRDYTFTPRRQGDDREGLSVLDLVALRKHILGQQPITAPTRLEAADVNRSSSITTLDVVVLTKVLLGLEQQFAQGSWRFSPQNITVVDLSNDLENQDFTGIKMGDLVFEHEQVFTPLGTTYRIDAMHVSAEEVFAYVKVVNFEQVAGFQFEITWDPAVLHFEEVEPLELPEGQSLLYAEGGPGAVRLVWQASAEQGHTLPDGAQLFRLRFTPTAPPGSTTALRFAPDFLPPQTVLHDCSVVGDAVYVDGGVQIVLTSVRELEAAGISLQLLRNPVPEGEPLRMNLSVQEPLRLQFRLHDAAGKLLWERTHPLSAGENTLELPLPPQAGLYLLQVQDETGRSGTLKVLRR